MNAAIVAVSGIRDVAPGDDAVIDFAVGDLLAAGRTQEMRFGGARGTDTIALSAACAFPVQVRRVVIVPATAAAQPHEARDVIARCAHAVEELHLDLHYPSSYHTRNLRLIDGAGILLAFWDGVPGGTSFTIRAAQNAGLQVEVVQLSGRAGGGAGFGALTAISGFPVPVFAVRQYVSPNKGFDPFSDYVRRAKYGYASNEEHEVWAELVASELVKRNLHPDIIIPVPRRTPGAPNDLAPLVQRIARRIGAQDGTDVLVRRREPTGGTIMFSRKRFPPAEHAASMGVDRSKVHGSPALALVLDNVLTTGGSLGGAFLALAQTPVATTLIGVALLSAGFHRTG